MKTKRPTPFILWLDEVGKDDILLVGGKNASLGEMVRHLKKKKVSVPSGFTLTTHAYRYVLEKANLNEEIRQQLKDLDPQDGAALAKAGHAIRSLILKVSFPDELKSEILHAYEELSRQHHLEKADVAVRSSATAEDLPTASFAGQQESFLNIVGEEALLDACRKCFASLFTDRAIAYRFNHNIDSLKTYLSVGVQKMVRSDKASSGVIFTLDMESGFKDVIYITGSYGLGENIVQGAVNPDEFYVFKPTFKQGYPAIINKRLGEKATKIIYSEKEAPTKKIETSESERSKFCLTDEEILKLAKWAIECEEHYRRTSKHWSPMDIEWAKDGDTGELFIVQARAETVHSQKKANVIEEFKLLEKGKILSKGKAVGHKIAQGVAHVIQDVSHIASFQEGEILITEMTDPDWVPIMRKAKAIVTNRGGRTSHAAIVSRELGLPCIVGTNDATQTIQTGQEITIDCSEGERGIVYDKLLKFQINTIDVKKIPKTKTHVMINIGYPDEAFKLSFLPSAGVGLARQEFIVNEHIRIHPMALVQFDRVEDPDIRRQIEMMTRGYDDKRQFFVDKLAQGVAMIAAAFYPRDVILRFSDFKTNEYVNLIGGKYFEPKEQNPMIGWRGASRYYKEGYEEGFALECRGIKKAREVFGLTNLKVMIPMCRTPEEGKKVLQVMKKQGLERGKKKLEVYVMCEIPSNVILADQYSRIFDGFSIGSNDLTQMVLGVDRDSELVADIYDENNEAVKRMIREVIKVARANKRKIGICGDAPSTYPEFTKFLIDCKIDSISLTPDALIKTLFVIAKHEQRQIKNKKRKS
ncbi:MAG: phosphoenolpyruvate synthase [Simkaniaceae bacterium]|nr:phosphoenolpyruvate synthase [Simkaniaceae bacterium]MCF7852593.1 phosphoenolpyruvate synthase [Simkaniaceae bacterium]